MPYLDAFINNYYNVEFKLEVYRKSTNSELVINGKGKCSKRYKESNK